jgi:hypothetical protein
MSKYSPQHPVLKHLQFEEMTVFWDVSPWSMTQVYWRSRTVYCLHHHGDECPEKRSIKHLWNAGKLLPVCAVQHPRRQPSSNSLLWENETSPSICFLTLGR